ncbi:MAG TPA: hypothetical protein VF957_09085 [Bradyrhizobium sp.]
MRSFWARRPTPYYPAKIHPALTSFAVEVCSTSARLIAYVGTLALIAILGLHLWDQIPPLEADEPAAKPGWSVASRSHPAFAVSQFDLAEKTGSYEILRHPEGGRKDVLRWAVQGAAEGERAVAELEIYRPGAEFDPLEPPIIELAARMRLEGAGELEAAGVVDSKFGKVTLSRHVGEADGPRACLAFLKRLDEPSLQISGWSCEGDALPARRAAIGCMLDRLVQLTARNDAKLAELFARAELRRGGCAAATPSAAPTDWMTGAENPRLRGAL